MKAKTTDPTLLTTIPGVGKSVSRDLQDIGIRRVADLKGKNPERLYCRSNEHAGAVQDRCLLYVFRCAVYYAEGGRDSEKLKWWNWKETRPLAKKSRTRGRMSRRQYA
ncbi:pathogenicity locus [Candidatus Nomurabacteria bacterium]|nr:pathogenicity locus [Candidatus Nomurabacteria bacterium]